MRDEYDFSNGVRGKYAAQMKVRLREDIFSRWIIVHPDDDNLAWSGSRWVPVTEQGFPAGAVQVSNLDTEDEAKQYAAQFGFTV